MGASCRRRATTREAFQAQSRLQESRRPPSRPRPPPIANENHTAPLWSEHLRTYVSYSWQEQQWKRWSTTAKIWKIILDINVVIRAESKLFELAMAGRRRMPQKPKESGWSDVLYYEPEALFVSYNSGTGNWNEWSEEMLGWRTAQLEDWPKMPVSKMAGEDMGSESSLSVAKVTTESEEFKTNKAPITVEDLHMFNSLPTKEQGVTTGAGIWKKGLEKFANSLYFRKQKANRPVVKRGS